MAPCGASLPKRIARPCATSAVPIRLHPFDMADAKCGRQLVQRNHGRIALSALKATKPTEISARCDILLREALFAAQSREISADELAHIHKRQDRDLHILHLTICIAFASCESIDRSQRGILLNKRFAHDHRSRFKSSADSEETSPPYLIDHLRDYRDGSRAVVANAGDRSGNDCAQHKRARVRRTTGTQPSTRPRDRGKARRRWRTNGRLH